MKRPTLALAVIAKNESHNIKQFFDSIEGCFDEVHFTDTGSTDDTVKLAEARGAIIHHFDWVNDFSAARNASFKPVTTDFVMWMDLDDVLENKEAFMKWRDDALGLADYWVATYHYASNAHGKPICSFARERVFRTKLKFNWKYFVHEGVLPQSDAGPVRVQYIPTWSIKHMRTEKDVQVDRSRNLNLFEERKTSLDGRMTYYYGKELFESGQHVEACNYLVKAVALNELEMHDRLLGIQYATYSYMACNQFDKAIQLAFQGIQLAPNRAEYHVSVGDCLLKQGRLIDAIPAYAAAKSCVNQTPTDRGFAGPIFTHEDAYTVFPRNQLVRIYAQMGDMARAEAEALECMKVKPNEETNKLLEEITKVKALQTHTEAKPCSDIVITCPPQGMYEWDGDIAKERGIGGSETAAVHMAYWLQKHSGRKVIVFNPRASAKTCDGVEYRPCQDIPGYFAQNKPFAHIAWRHNIKITDAPTFFWCHDLVAFGGENTANYEKLLCLSPFSSRYVQAMQGIPADKIHLTRNGIDPKRFLGPSPAKDPNRVMFPSSPDRGLDRAMRIMDLMRVEFPDLELHVYYGFDNMRKSGPHMVAMADRLEAMMKERPWVKYHGNVQQDVLADHMKRSVLWLHPADFIETFCITAIEMLASGVFTVTRRLGALQDTCAEAEKSGMATLLDLDCQTEEEYRAWADAALDAMRNKRWEQVKADPRQFAWEGVAKEWLETFLAYGEERAAASLGG